MQEPVCISTLQAGLSASKISLLPAHTDMLTCQWHGVTVLASLQP